MPLEMRHRAQDGLELQASGVRVVLAPDAKHREARARENCDEAELVVARKTVPEVRAEIRDDQERRSVEDDPFTRVPRSDVFAPFSPDQVDEERNGEEEGDPQQHSDRGERAVEV